MSEDRIRPDVLARITEDSQLARAVPLLAPQVLHAVIARCGLQDCGELLALATPQQLSAVFDLDLWKAERAGADEQFDPARFCEWLEVLVEAGPAIAAGKLSAIDTALVVAGLTPQIAVFDPGVFEPVMEVSSADPVLNAGRERGVHAEIGGYVVVARRTDAWDAIVALLDALCEQHSGAFHRVMRGCRRLSDAGHEIDGLDNLLSNEGQELLDLSLSREQRRDRLGYLSADQARAFLDGARHVSLGGAEPPLADVVFAANQRSQAQEDETTPSGDTGLAEAAADMAPATAGVVTILRDAGVLADTPRALPAGVQDTAEPVDAALREFLRLNAEADPDGWSVRNQELAFLANALVAGCSVQGRAFTPSEAADAVAATCNLGLDCWPSPGVAAGETLVTVFKVGWARVHNDVSMFAAERLIEALDGIPSSDQDLQFDLRVLRRELHRQWQAGTPWRARGRLDVLATLDLPAWAAVTALLDECPVMLSNVCASGHERPHTVNPSDFRFIADGGHVAAIHAFLSSLPALFTGQG